MGRQSREYAALSQDSVTVSCKPSYGNSDPLLASKGYPHSYAYTTYRPPHIYLEIKIFFRRRD